MLEQDSQKKLKWKLALRIATSPSDRWLRKAADWNPELSTRYRINRAIGRPRKRWEDDINEFFKQEFEDTKDPIESNNQTNKTWISIAKDRGNWDLLEEAYTMTVEERQEMRKKKEEKMIKADQRDNLMGETECRRNNQHRKIKQKDAAAPQFRTACINKMMHLENSSKSAFNDFVMG